MHNPSAVDREDESGNTSELPSEPSFGDILNQFEQIGYQAGLFLAGDAMNAGIELKILGRGQVGVDAKEVGHVANVALDLGRGFANLCSIEPDFAM